MERSVERPKFNPTVKTYTIKDELRQLVRAYHDYFKRIGIYARDEKTK